MEGREENNNRGHTPAPPAGEQAVSDRPGSQQELLSNDQAPTDLADLLQDPALVERTRKALLWYQRDPTPEALLATTAKELEAAAGFGPGSRRAVEATLRARGLSLAAPKPKARKRQPWQDDPRVDAVLNLWAEVYRARVAQDPEARVPWDMPVRGVFKRVHDKHRAVMIAEQGHVQRRDPTGTLTEVRLAFEHYLGDLGAPQNWPHEPTLEGFCRKLTARFTGAATPTQPRRGRRDEVGLTELAQRLSGSSSLSTTEPSLGFGFTTPFQLPES